MTPASSYEDSGGHLHASLPMIREASGIASLDIDEESAFHAGRLPGLHSDPFDRMLVAQAIVHGMAIQSSMPER